MQQTPRRIAPRSLWLSDVVGPIFYELDFEGSTKTNLAPSALVTESLTPLFLSCLAMSSAASRALATGCLPTCVIKSPGRMPARAAADRGETAVTSAPL